MTLTLPLWAAVPFALLLVVGALLAFLGALGLVRAPTFYARAHPPTLGSTLGMTLILLASALYFTVSGSRLSVHELLLIVALPLVAPVTMMLLARAALSRDPDLSRSVDSLEETDAVLPSDPDAARTAGDEVGAGTGTGGDA